MVAPSRKESLISRIQEVEDDEIIDHLIRFLEMELETKHESVYILTPEEEAAIEEGDRDVLNGHVLSEEEANESAQKWLL
jgi:hypothetical protein